MERLSAKRLSFILLALLLAVSALFLAACSGTQGIAGKDGKDGTNGTDGTNGVDGVNGIDGIDGIDGEDGIDGVDGVNAYKQITADYKYLPKDNVFTTLVYHDFFHLLSNPRVTPGEYIVLIGGTWDVNTQGVIGLVDEAAKEKGIDEIYLFDPKLDAGLSEKIVGKIGNNAADPANIGKVGYTYDGKDYLYDDLEISKYKYGGKTLLENVKAALVNEAGLLLNEDGTVKTPQLLILGKAQETSENVATAKAANNVLYDSVANYTLVDTISDDGLTLYGDAELAKTVYSETKATIKGSLVPQIPYSRKNFVPAIDSADYIAQLEAFLNANVGSGAAIDTSALKDYDVFTVKNQAQASGGGTTRLKNNTNAAGEKLFSTVTFEQLIKTFESEGEHLIYWGGMWCPNSAVYYAAVQAQAVKSGYDGQIVLFDPKLDGNGQNIRSNDSVATANASGNHSRLYAYIIENYLPDYASRWNTDGSKTKRVFGIKDVGNTPVVSINGKEYTRICVPNIAIYNNAVTGGIVDSFESELTWNAGSSTTSNTQSKDSQAYKFRKTNLENLFGKLGLSEQFIAAGYEFTVSFRGLEAVYKAYKSDTDYFTATSYYFADQASAEAYPQSYTASGSTVNYQPGGRYPVSLAEAFAAGGLTKKSGANILFKGAGSALTLAETIPGWAVD